MRRRVGLLLALVILLIPDPLVAQDLPMTGTAVAGMASFDRAVVQLMGKWRIPGAALAVGRDGRLVLARGYGRADVQANQLVQPNSRFRIASISKSLTATAILKLVENGKLQLDAKAFAILDQFRPPAVATADPRVAEITVRQLLHHGSGLPERAAPLGTCAEAIRLELGRMLDFAPGTRYAYSDAGYCVLGRIIEKVSGQRYEEYVQSSVLSPAGIRRVQIGRNDPKERAAGEVVYYGGGFPVEGIDSAGGWIASPIDLLRFVYALEGRRGNIFQSQETFRMMLARPTPPLGSFTFVGTGIRFDIREGAVVIGDVFPDSPAAQAGLRPGDVITAIDGRDTRGRTLEQIAQAIRGQEGSTVELTIQRPGATQTIVVRITRRLIVRPDYWYAMGWRVFREEGGVTWWHTGSAPGTAAFLMRVAEGWTWAALFNSRPPQRDVDAFFDELEAAMRLAARQVTEWPGHDLFGQYP